MKNSLHAWGNGFLLPLSCLLCSFLRFWYVPNGSLPRPLTTILQLLRRKSPLFLRLRSGWSLHTPTAPPLPNVTSLHWCRYPNSKIGHVYAHLVQHQIGLSCKPDTHSELLAHSIQTCLYHSKSFGEPVEADAKVGVSAFPVRNMFDG